MEADWSVEIGSGLAQINSPWEGFIDLRKSPQSIDTLAEAAQHPSLRAALISLNAEGSPVFTTKSDIWTLAEDEIDPYEFEARSEDTRAGFASYIDVLEQEATQFASFPFHEQRARDLISHLRSIHSRQGRVDLVVRDATINEDHGFGLTLYAAGCGRSASEAYAAWKLNLAAAVAATISAAHPPHARASSSIG